MKRVSVLDSSQVSGEVQALAIAYAKSGIITERTSRKHGFQHRRTDDLAQFAEGAFL
jgi:hypothetical protein